MDTTLSVFAENGRYEFYNASGEKITAVGYDDNRLTYHMPIKKDESILMVPTGIPMDRVVVRKTELDRKYRL